MDQQQYRDLFSRISPSPELIEQTKEKMRDQMRLERVCRCSFARSRRMLTRLSASAAAVVLVFSLGVNLSPAFADAVRDVPVLGSIAEVVTLKNYFEQKDNVSYSVRQPAVADDQGQVQDDVVNQQIQQAIDTYLADAQQRIEEYKEAYLATGGTEEEFLSRNIQVQVDYQVFSQTEDTLSFALYMDENWVNSYGIVKYYNLDLQTGQPLTLQDLLGDNWQSMVNEEIAAQIQQQEQEGVPYLIDESTFSGVTDQTKFYINDQHQIVIVFDKYEIAPGSSGRPEFVLPFTPLI
ncbi:DUF3298 domain-containing protein [uncultured Negativibacillus sp.]|uniref:DUF3298 domain-containing protein n=1 Tax=uncultured Negativibacillus sp. TaxID=1980696 RepID=UPI0025E9BD6A|nr:DUF3298 domain-containing protein [uncultured Negativibacillus sp.]